MKSHPRAGQFNLRGKRFKLLRCKCCEVQDFREREATRQAQKDIKQFAKVKE